MYQVDPKIEERFLQVEAMAVHMLRLHFCHAAPDEDLDRFSDQFTWVGSLEDEYFPFPPFAQENFLAPDKRFYQCSVEQEFYDTDEIAPDLYLCTGQACLIGSDVSGPPLNLHLRFSFVFHWTENGPQCCHAHCSAPYVDISNQDAIPEEEVHRRQELYRLAAECSSDIMYEYIPDTDSAILYRFDHHASGKDMVVESKISDCRRQLGQGNLFHPGDAQLALENICNCRCTPFDARIYDTGATGEDHYQWYHITGKRMEKDGKILRVVGTIRNIHTEKVTQQALVEEAGRDYLTGLFTRRYAIRMIGEYLMNEISYGFLLMDLDNFKSINDNYGHAMGDTVLMQMSQLLQRTFRSSDICARLGGDEFLIFLPNGTSSSMLEKRASRIVQDFQTILTDLNISVPAGVSIGGIYGSNCTDFEDLYRKVDDLLYQVKNSKKGGWLIRPYT